MNEPKPRTEQQSRALHLFCGQLAEVLNDAGLDMRKVLKPTYNLPWTKESVKEHLWRAVQKAMFNKQSTTQLLKQGEIDAIYEVLVRELGEKHHIEVPPFPNDPTRQDAPLVIETPIWRS